MASQLEFLSRPNSDDDTSLVPETTEPVVASDPQEVEPEQPQPEEVAPVAEPLAPVEQPPVEPPTVEAASTSAPPQASETTKDSPVPDNQTNGNMSYADIAAKGPKQSDEEKIPDAVPEIAHSDSGVHSLDSLQSPHISSVPSSYADQQLEVERAEEEAQKTAETAKEEAKDFGARAEQEGEKLKDKAERKANELKKEAGLEKDKAKKGAKKAEAWADRNKDNPVVIGNGVVLAALGGLLGYGAYRKHTAGQLTPKLIAAWTGALGLFAIGDYYVSQFFFKKYPAK